MTCFDDERVSHHPMIVACHCEGTGWKLWGDSNLKSKFWGRSIQLDPVGVLTLEFDDGEVFQWSKVTTSIYNLILGKLYCEHYGTMRIQGNRGFSCKLKFKEQSIIDRTPHQKLVLLVSIETKVFRTENRIRIGFFKTRTIHRFGDESVRFTPNLTDSLQFTFFVT
ncbi:Oxysterol-binding protein-related protein [Drosera capensis]